MALPRPIAPSQTDSNSPVDDNLMDSIRIDLDYMDNVLSTQGAIFSFNANGPLRRLSAFKKPVDTVPMYNEFRPNKARAVLKKSGTGGSLEMDLRRIYTPNTPIVGIDHLFEGATQSVGNINPAVATQSIARSASPISTQSITFAKASINITSIINVGIDLWRYNLDATPDSDYLSGASVEFSSTSAPGNSGTFDVVEINDSGYPSIVISNASGVAQVSAAGSAQLNLMSYNMSNPVSVQYLAGDNAVFATHTSGTNDGTFPIYKTNQGGNNIWIVNAGVTQGGAAGTVSNLVWVFTFLSAVSTPDFTVGEKAKTTSHSSGANNGNFEIRAINSGGNNLYLYNSSGVAQAGVAGAVGTNRWAYGLSVDPSTFITAGDGLQLESHTTSANNGIFVCKQVNRLAVNNVIVYNESGVIQSSPAGFVRTVRKLIKFASDQSLVYSVNDIIDIIGASDPLYNYSDWVDSFLITGINYGGGANYNVVISLENGASQPNPSGFIYQRAVSILTAPFIVDAVAVGEPTPYVGAPTPVKFLTGETEDLDGLTIDDGVPLALYILSVPDGDPRDLTVTLH